MFKKIMKGLDSTPSTPKIGRVPLPDVEELGEGVGFNRLMADRSGFLSESESPSPSRARTPGMFSRRSATPQVEPGPVPESPRRRRPSSPRESPLSPGPLFPQAHAPIPRRPPCRSILSGMSSSRSSTPDTASSAGSSAASSTGSSSSSSAASSAESSSTLSSVSSAAPSSHMSTSSSNRAPPLRGILKPAKRDPLLEITLHWQLLQFNPTKASQMIEFDITHPPTEIRRISGGKRLHLTPTDMQKPAAVPMQTEMILTHPFLPYWDIEVSNPKGITCVDVWRAIYDTFNQPLDCNEERRFVSSNDARKMKFKEAFEKRCERVAALPDWERKQGLKRVDLLTGATFFKGLRRPAANGTDDCLKPGRRWVLELGRRERL